MKTEQISKIPARDHLQTRTKCDRCGAPCGMDEPEKTYEVRSCQIATASSKTVKR